MTAADPSAYASAIRAALLSDPSVGIPARVDPELAAWVHMTAEHLAGLLPLMADAAEQRVLARAKAIREVERAEQRIAERMLELPNSRDFVPRAEMVRLAHRCEQAEAELARIKEEL